MMNSFRLEQLAIAVFVLLSLGWVSMKQGNSPVIDTESSYTTSDANHNDQSGKELLTERPSKWRVKAGSVHDGDTFRAISLTGEEIKVRLSCIDAPEIKQAGGIESRDFLRKMLPDEKEVILSIAEEDRFGRKVAEVFVPIPNSEEEVAVNGEMIVNGHAHFYGKYRSACPDNADQYENLEAIARGGRIGLWSSNTVILPEQFRRKNK